MSVSWGIHELLIGAMGVAAGTAFAVDYLTPPGDGIAGRIGVGCLVIGAVIYSRRHNARAADDTKEAVQRAEAALKQAFDEMQGQTWRKGLEAGLRRTADQEEEQGDLAVVHELAPRDRRGTI